MYLFCITLKQNASAVFPSCQCGCVPIVVRLGNCRDLAVSAIWLHQATCLTYTLLSPTHERETLVVGGTGSRVLTSAVPIHSGDLSAPPTRLRTVLKVGTHPTACTRFNPHASWCGGHIKQCRNRKVAKSASACQGTHVSKPYRALTPASPTTLNYHNNYIRTFVNKQ
jgi:hypothetical protein